MANPGELSKEAFLYLAQQAGLDLADRHMEELYPYVINVLASIESLALIDVSGFEPEMAFAPPESALPEAGSAKVDPEPRS